MEIKRFGFYFLLIIIFLIAAKFYSIINTLFPAIASGCVFAYLSQPLYKWILKIFKKKSLSAMIVIVLFSVVVLIPSIFVVFAVQSQLSIFFSENSITNAEKFLANIDSFVYNRFNLPISRDYFSSMLPVIVDGTQKNVRALIPQMLIGMTKFAISIFVTFFIMYYMLINSRIVSKTFSDYFPLSYKNIDILLEKIGKETRTLILGQFLIAAIQGLLGALGFFIFGVKGVFLWGFVMMILSFIPFLGSFMVWLPASLYLIVKGEFYDGLGLILWGTFIVGTIDNVIRPKLTSLLGKIHPVTVLLGVFIGLKEWGFIGLVLGPLTISILFNLIKMFREEYISE